jgi:hypothetical protein
VGDVTVDAAADDELYACLARPFEETFWDNRGGVDLEYVTGEQVTSRLNQEVGFMNWSFRVLEHGIHNEADECWVMGELTIVMDGRTVVRQQFGSQKVKRSRSSGTPLDIGFDLKGAATDCLKKCATLVGVGLWLSAKEAGPDGKPIPKGRPERRPRGRPSADSRLRQMANDAPPTKPAPAAKAPAEAPVARPTLVPPPKADPTPPTPGAERAAVACKECSEEIWPDREIKLKEKTITGADLIEKGQAEFKKALCLTCFGRYWAARHETPAAAVTG